MGAPPRVWQQYESLNLLQPRRTQYINDFSSFANDKNIVFHILLDKSLRIFSRFFRFVTR